MCFKQSDDRDIGAISELYYKFLAHTREGQTTV